jgi:membrane associated rhomboid family serine protease
MSEIETWAKEQDPGQLSRRLHDEARRRGHPRRTAYAGVGGLFGALLGSFFGRAGAGLGGLLGALFGAVLGHRRDREPTRALPAPRGELPAQAEPVRRLAPR